MAAEPAFVWEAGLCFSEAARGAFCGRMFLACVSEAPDFTEAKRGVLADETGEECREGPVGDADAEAGRLEGHPRVGVCAGP